MTWCFPLGRWCYLCHLLFSNLHCFLLFLANSCEKLFLVPWAIDFIIPIEGSNLGPSLQSVERLHVALDRSAPTTGYRLTPWYYIHETFAFVVENLFQIVTILYICLNGKEKKSQIQKILNTKTASRHWFEHSDITWTFYRKDKGYNKKQ